MSSIDQVSQGVAGLSVSGRKKKTARAYHDLQAFQTQPSFNSPLQPPTPVSQFNSFGDQSPAIQSPGIPNTSTFGYQNQIVKSQEPQRHQEVNISQATSGDSLSVPYARKLDENEWKYNVFKSFENTLPPTSTTEYQSFDQSISTAKFSRLSLYQIPVNEQLRQQSKLPLGLTVRPFAPVDESEQPIPVVDTTPTNGPIRCHRCRGYLNPMMVFTHDGKFHCNLCKFANPVPNEYYCQLGMDGKRQDYLQRPELYTGTVDFIVPEEYWDQEKVQPSALHFIFLIDVSASNEIIQATTEAIKSALYSLPFGCKIGIVTYDEKIHFYNLNSEIPSVHVISDIEDPFVPIYDGLFVDPQENDLQISSTLMQINELYSQFKSGTIAYGSALKAANLALKEVGGGKIIANITKSPSAGPGFLNITNSTDKGGSSIFKHDNEYYYNLSNEFVSNNVGLDLFILSQSSIDLKNSGLNVFKTAGALKLYPTFSIEKDEISYIQDFIQSVKHTVGYQGSLKTRCSNGLQIQSYYGNFDAKESQDPKIPTLSTELEVSILFKYDSKLNSKEDFSFQTAVLYTDTQGIRKVRVINNTAAVTTELSNVFAFADQDTILNIIIKNCLDHLTKQHSREIKNSTTDKLTEIFTQYRSLISSNSNPTQLILPDSLSSLTAYISSFQKSRVFKTSINNNLKLYDYYKLNALPLDRLLLQLYPRFIELHSFQDYDCEFDEHGKFNMPVNIRASAQFIQAGGCYLIFNGEELFVYIHQQVNPLLLKDLFNVNSSEELSPTLSCLPELATDVSRKTRNLITYFQNYLKLNELSVRLIRQGIDHLEFQFNELLVEDRSLDKTPSFIELVQQIHKSIKENLQSGKAGGGSASSNGSSFNNLTRGGGGGGSNSLDESLSQSFVHF